MKPFVFIDRDDTVIYDVPYLNDPSRVSLTPGAAGALQALRDAGFGVIMVTNQSGVGRGLITLEQMRQVNRRMEELLAEGGAFLDALYYCPHRPDEGCECRKPKTGMLKRACQDFQVNLGRSAMVGDSRGDMEMGRAFGLKTVHICLPGLERPRMEVDFRASSLVEAVPFLIGLLESPGNGN